VPPVFARAAITLGIGPHSSFGFPLASIIAFGALTLLVGCQEEHPTCKKLCDEVLAWLSCVKPGANDLYKVQLMPLPSSVASLKSRMV